MGAPVASDFFEPQNRIAIRSARVKGFKWPRKFVVQSARARIARSTAASRASVAGLIPRHNPATTAALNAA